MKTLKKTLCLVLAMVMVLGLGVMSASAKLDNYPDKDKIEYAEAVDVLSGIGILQGDAGGFRPKDSITRAEAAKIIAYIMIGNAAQADALKASADPFTDVPSSHWAAGYIAYCNASGIIKGMGDGTYHPSDKVTGLQFATMLLRALGYGAKDEYSGTDWAINASKDGIRLGVFVDNLEGANTDPATREECALYAFNVIARGRDLEDGTPQYGLSKVSWSDLLGRYDDGNAFGSTDANKMNTFAKDFGLSKDDADDNAFGHPTEYHWTQKIGSTTKTITADYPDTSKDMTLFTTKVTGADMYELFGSDAKKLNNAWDGANSCAGDGATIELYVDGAATQLTLNPNTYFLKGKDDKIPGTGNGVETYVYSQYDDQGVLNVRICIVNTWLAKVDKVVAAKSNSEAKTSVEILSATNAPNLSGKTYETEEFEEGDYVLVTVSASASTAGFAIQSMEAATIVENTVSRYTKDGDKISVTSGGTTYVAAENTATDDAEVHKGNDPAAVNKGIVDGEDKKLYVDKYGYLIAVENVTAESNYVYAVHFGSKADTSGAFDEAGYAVKLYYSDGTDNVVGLKSLSCGGTNVAVDVATDSNHVGIYKVIWDGTKAKLTDTHANVSKATDNAYTNALGNVKKGIASSVDKDSNITADNNTVFFYVEATKAEDGSLTLPEKYEDYKVTAYKGINSVPRNNKGADAPVEQIIFTTDKDGNKIAKAVLVYDISEGESTDTVYFFTGDYDVDENNWTVTYQTYVDGKLSPLKVSYKDKEDKDKGVGLFIATNDADEDDGNVVNQFFTVKASNKPVALTYAEADKASKEINKYKYVIGEIAADAANNFNYVVTNDAGANIDVSFADTGAIWDMRVDPASKIEGKSDLIAAVDDAAVNVAVQYGDAGNYIYIFDAD